MLYAGVDRFPAVIDTDQYGQNIRFVFQTVFVQSKQQILRTVSVKTFVDDAKLRMVKNGSEMTVDIGNIAVPKVIGSVFSVCSRNTVAEKQICFHIAFPRLSALQFYYNRISGVSQPRFDKILYGYYKNKSRSRAICFGVWIILRIRLLCFRG